MIRLFELKAVFEDKPFQQPGSFDIDLGGRFDLLELLELDGVFGNQLIQCAKVSADFLLFFSSGNTDG